MDCLNGLGEKFRNYFPETIFELGRVGQPENVAEEVGEALDAVDSDEKFLREVVDIIQASFTALYKARYSDEQIRGAIEDVKEKNGNRGYFTVK